MKAGEIQHTLTAHLKASIERGKLNAEQMAKPDAASEKAPVYPYWHQRGFQERNPPPIHLYG